MDWIETRKGDYVTHAMDLSTRERVLVNGEWMWRAKALCGRTVTGYSGASAYAAIVTCRGRGCQAAVKRY